MKTIRRSGDYLRVADPEWDDPLDGNYSMRQGGRWNPPGSFPVIYLCMDIKVARANVERKFKDQPFGPEDLDPKEAPALVTTRIPLKNFIDVITDAGCIATGLPASYPFDVKGKMVTHETCQPIGQEAWDSNSPGVASRSAALEAPDGGEELAWFQRRTKLKLKNVQHFDEWYLTQRGLIHKQKMN